MFPSREISRGYVKMPPLFVKNVRNISHTWSKLHTELPVADA